MENPKPPTGADVRNAGVKIEEITKEIAGQMKIRQWCVEQAVKCAPNDVEVNTKFFYNFVTGKEEKHNA